MVSLSVILLIAYAEVLKAPPLSWDDPVWLEDPVATGAAPLAEAFTTARDGVYAPVLRLAFRALLALGGSPTLLHGAVLACFFAALFPSLRVLQRLDVPQYARQSALMVWVLMAGRVENLAWITGLKDTLSLLLLMSGAALMPRRQALATGLVVLALGTRGSTATAVFALAVLTWAREGLPALRRWTAPGLAAVVTIVVAQQAWVAGPGNAAFPPGSRLGLMAALTGAALRGWASTPCAIYPPPTVSALDGFALAVALAALVGLARGPAKPRGAVAIGLAWLLCMAPFLGVTGMAFWSADRHRLLPDLIVITALFSHLAATERLGSWRVAVFAGAGMLLGSVQTFNRVHAWTSDLALWTADVSCEGDHWARRYNLGMAQAKDSRFDAAVASFTAGLSLKPDHDGMRGRLIIARLAASHWDAGAATLAALAVPPPDRPGWVTLALGLAQHGDLDLAELALAPALTPPALPDAVSLGANLTLRHGDANAPNGIGRDPAENGTKLREMSP